MEERENHVFCNGCNYDYGEYPTTEELQTHALYDENGNERDDEGFALHGGYHDDYITVKKTVEYQVCTVCKMEK